MFDRNNPSVLDLAHFFHAYILYEEEGIMDRFPDAEIDEICKTMAEEGVVLSAENLRLKAVECAESGIYELGYEGFRPVCEALGIEDDFQDGTELYCVIMALYARTHPEFRNDALDRIDNCMFDFEEENWEYYNEGAGNWTNKERQDLKNRMTAHWAENIYGKGL